MKSQVIICRILIVDPYQYFIKTLNCFHFHLQRIFVHNVRFSLEMLFFFGILKNYWNHILEVQSEAYDHHMQCDICHINFCKTCVMEHLSEESKDNKLVLFNKRISAITYPRCQKHAAEIYDFTVNNAHFQYVIMNLTPESR